MRARRELAGQRSEGNREPRRAGGGPGGGSARNGRGKTSGRLYDTPYGQIDIVVNNAGATKRGEFLQLTDEDWADGFALKFFGAMRLTREAWPHLKKQAGSVLNISGVGGRMPGPLFTIGGSVNAALLSFTKAMADIGIRDGVQVNAINPGQHPDGSLSGACWKHRLSSKGSTWRQPSAN